MMKNVLMICVVLLIVMAAGADIIAPTMDTYFLAENGGWTGGAADQFLGAGYNPSGRERNAMMMFDVSAYSGMIIQSANLWIYKHSGGTATQKPVTVHQVTNQWDASASWNNRLSGVAWDTPGGDYDSMAIASNGPTGNSPEGWYSLDITFLVQDWVDGIYNNYGLCLDNTGTYVYIRSADYAGTTYDPYLEVTVIPEPATILLLGISTSVLVSRRRR